MLVYVARWNERDEKNTWSGTTYSLYNALTKKQNIQRVDALNPNLINKLFYKIQGTTFDFDVDFSCRVSEKIKANVSSKDEVIQIGDLVELPSYIYQDMSFSVLDDLYKHDPTTFRYSGFKIRNDKSFQKRMAFQEKIYASNTIILSMSHWFKKFLNSQGKQNVYYVGGGINIPSSIDMKVKREMKTILFVGRDFERKGGKLVVEAFKRVYKYDKQIRLIVAGPKHIPNECKDVSGLKFVGAINYSEVARLMKVASIFAMPSYYEAYGLVFIEAMASGMTIIARNKFEMPYFVEEGSGLLIQSADEEQEVQQLVDNFRKILKDTSYIRIAEQRAESIKNKFSWDQVATNILNVVYGL